MIAAITNTSGRCLHVRYAPNTLSARKNHLRSGDITVDREAAGTRMGSFRQHLGLHRSARRTRSAGIPGIDLDHFSTSIFRFVPKLAEENVPTSIENASRHAGSGKPFDIQFFNSDHAVFVHQPTADRVAEVSTLRCDPLMVASQSDSVRP